MSRPFLMATGAFVMAVGCLVTLFETPKWLGWSGVLVILIGFIMTFIANNPPPHNDRQISSD